MRIQCQVRRSKSLALAAIVLALVAIIAMLGREWVMAASETAVDPAGSTHLSLLDLYLPLVVRSAGGAATTPPAVSATPTPPPVDSRTPAPTPWPLPSPVPLPTFMAEPLSPIFHARGSSYAVTVNGDYAYLGIGPTLVVVDIRDLARLQPVSRFMLRGLVEQIVVRGQWLWVVAGNGGLFVFDATDPAAPRYVSHLPALRSSLDIAFLGDLAYVAEGGAGVRVLDVSDPTALGEVHVLDTPGPALACDLADRRLYVAVAADGLRSTT